MSAKGSITDATEPWEPQSLSESMRRMLMSPEERAVDDLFTPLGFGFRLHHGDDYRPPLPGIVVEVRTENGGFQALIGPEFVGNEAGFKAEVARRWNFDADFVGRPRVAV